MSTPAPRHFCPRCRASYPAPQPFCSECGADMLRVSALDLAAARDAATGGDGVPASRADRRVTASTRTWLGTIVDGRYRVLEVIGRGGMGVVYKVEHVRMGKIAAMKVLHHDLADDPDVIGRFEREAAAVSRLQHPNAVAVFDFGTTHGALYLIMEYVRGQDLATIIERDGPQPFSRAAPLLTQILGALTEAHELGIVHRDLKPDNVLVTRTTGGRDFAKVLDFGLAKVAHTGAPDVSDRSQIVGTPYFMAPEQIRGDDVDPRTDVYAMGALAYRLLTGTYVFTASSAVGVLTKHLTTDPDPPSARVPSLAPELDRVILRALAKDPSDRWESAAAMATALDEVYAALVGDRNQLVAQRARPGASASRSRASTEDDEPLSELRLRRADIDAYERSLRRGRWFATLGVGAVVGGLALGAVWWLRPRADAPVRIEREPNDSAAHANRIAIDAPVAGWLGRRRSPTQPDLDVFRVARPASGAIAVELAAVPNIDVALTVRDGSGRVVSQVDEQPMGGDERLDPRTVDGEITIEVAQVMLTPLPVENVSDRYRLTVRAPTPDRGQEREPNGDASDATPIGADAPVRGRLESRTDVDALRWTGPPGPVVVEVTAPPQPPISWRGPDGTDRSVGRATLTLTTDAVVTLRRRDRDAPKGAIAAADATWSVAIVPAR